MFTAPSPGLPWCALSRLSPGARQQPSGSQRLLDSTLSSSVPAAPTHLGELPVCGDQERKASYAMADVSLANDAFRPLDRGVQTSIEWPQAQTLIKMEGFSKLFSASLSSFWGPVVRDEWWHSAAEAMWPHWVTCALISSVSPSGAQFLAHRGWMLNKQTRVSEWMNDELSNVGRKKNVIMKIPHLCQNYNLIFFPF